MRKLKLCILPVLVFIAFTTCNKDEVTPREYPRVKTLDVNEITEFGARFNAEIIYPGNGEITEYGFVWGETENPTIESSEKRILAQNIRTGGFTAEILTTLKEEVTYYVRAYAKNNEYLVYGKNVSFLSLGSKAPEISSINSNEGTIGDTVLIRGNGFSFLSKENDVKFNDIKATTISANDSIITVIVPEINKEKSNVTVSIAGNPSGHVKFFTTTPIIESLSNTALAISDTLIIDGNNFSHELDANILKIGGIQSTVVYSGKKEIKAIIPPDLQSENVVELSIAGQTTFANQKVNFLEPELNSVEPELTTFGDTLIIYGNHLSPNIGSNKVYMGEISATIIAASKNEIQFIVPDNLNSITNNVTLKVAGRELVSSDIKIKAPVIKAITPSYIDSFENGNIEIYGENFNTNLSKNTVRIGGKYTSIVQVGHDKIVVDFPRSLIPDIDLSVIDTVDVVVTTLGQVGELNEALTLNYKSKWTKKNSFPGEPRADVVQFQIGDKAYVGMGKDDSPYANPLSDLWQYDLTKNVWTKKSDFPGSHRLGQSAFVINGKAYIVGGKASWNDAPDKNELWEYDPQTDKWNRKADFLGPARYNAIGFERSGKGYFGGGENKEGFNIIHHSDLWEYNHISDSWNQKNDFKDDYSLRYVFNYGNDIYMSGFGIFRIGSIYKYNPVNDQWLVIEHTNFEGFPPSRPMVINGLAYFLELYDQTIHTYDLINGSWQNDLNFKGLGRYNAVTFSFGNKGYIMMGADSNDYLSDVWEFNSELQ